MNQAILLNDDYIYNTSKKAWKFTGLIGGQLITIHISTDKSILTAETKFTFEDMVEDYLADNEPDEDNNIWL